MKTLPASQPITVLELVSDALKAVSSPHLPAEGRRAIAEGLINAQVKDAAQRDILLQLAIESAGTREDLAAAYERLGAQLDPKGLLRMPTRFERAQAGSVFQAINLAAADVGLVPHPYFEGALKLVVVDDGGTFSDVMKSIDFKGPHAGTGSNLWRRIEVDDIRYIKPHDESGFKRGRDPMTVELNLGSTHQGDRGYSTDYRMSGGLDAGGWPQGVPLQSAHDLEHFIDRVKAQPARFGVASVEAFDRFVGLYRSTNEVKTTTTLVSLIGALEVALDVKLDPKGARALKEAFNSEPRMPLEALIAKFALFPPTENRPQDYQGLPPVT